jgi:hypothetical protein
MFDVRPETGFGLRHTWLPLAPVSALCFSAAGGRGPMLRAVQIAVSRGAVVVLALLIVAGCTKQAPNPSPRPAPSSSPGSAAAPAKVVHGSISLTSPPAGQTLAVKAAKLPSAAYEGLRRWTSLGVIVGTPFAAEADGTIPPSGVQISRSYPAPIPEGIAIQLAFFDPTLNGWRVVPSQIAPDRRSVSATVTHLSLWDDVIAGSPQQLETFRSAMDSAGREVKSIAKKSYSNLKKFNDAAIKLYEQAADELYYAVGGMFDVRVPAPTCEGDPPGWVQDVIFLDDRNTAIRWCAGHDKDDPSLLVIKARVNRGFGFLVETAAKPERVHNSTYDQASLDDLLEDLAQADQILGKSLREVLGQGKLVGPAKEIDFTFDQAAARTVRDSKPLVTFAPPSTAVFLISTLSAQVVDTGAGLVEGWATGIISVARCTNQINTASDLLGGLNALQTCVQEAAEIIARNLAAGLVKLGVDPKKAGEASGKLLGKLTIYMALIQPVFNIFNFAAEKMIPVALRTFAVITKVPLSIRGEWFVHGGTLKIRADYTATSISYNQPCGPNGPDGFPTDVCNQYTQLTARTENQRSVRLTVKSVSLRNTAGKRYPLTDQPLQHVGDYYSMKLLANRRATTELHKRNGALRVPADQANNLGNPYLCPAGDSNTDGICGA